MHTLQDLNKLIDVYQKLTGELALTKRVVTKLILNAQPILRIETLKRHKDWQRHSYYVIEKYHDFDSYKLDDSYRLGKLLWLSSDTLTIMWVMNSRGRLDITLDEEISLHNNLRSLYLIEEERYKEIFEKVSLE
jgi:hypothetical protein